MQFFLTLDQFADRARERLSPLPPPLPDGPVPSAVLVPVVRRATGPSVLLTQRRADLPHHPGQICFPGGRIRNGEDPLRAALRETEEETGITRRDVTPLGFLDPWETGTGFVIAPLVGVVAADCRLRPCAREVEEIFEVPLETALNPDNHVQELVESRGDKRLHWVIRHHERFIWGATAGILRMLWERLHD